MIINRNSNFFYYQKTLSKQAVKQQPSFGCKVINVSASRLSEITKEFENIHKISDMCPIPPFLEKINISKILKPMFGTPPKHNPKPKSFISWKPEMSDNEARKWSINSVFSQIFYHGTTKESLAKVKQEGFDTRLSGELQCGGGIYVTPNYNEAKGYSDSTVATMRINIANPLMIDNSNLIEFDKLRVKFDKEIRDFSKKMSYSQDEREALFNEEMRRFFTRQGFDMIKNQTYNHFIVLNPQDITLIKP